MKAIEVLLDRWKASPEGGKAMSEATESEVAERQAMVAESASLTKELLQALKDPRKAVESAAAEVEKARSALRDAEHSHGQAQLVVHNFQSRADSRRAELEHQLRAGAYPGVAEFLNVITGLWDHERFNWVGPLIDGARLTARERLDQIRSITEQAEALLFEPDVQLAERELERLKGEIAKPGRVAA